MSGATVFALLVIAALFFFLAIAELLERTAKKRIHSLSSAIVSAASQIQEAGKNPSNCLDLESAEDFLEQAKNHHLQAIHNESNLESIDLAERGLLLASHAMELSRERHRNGVSSEALRLN